MLVLLAVLVFVGFAIEVCTVASRGVDGCVEVYIFL